MAKPKKSVDHFDFSSSYKVILVDGFAHVEDDDMLRIIVLSNRPGKIKGDMAYSSCVAEAEILVSRPVVSKLLETLSEYAKKKPRKGRK